MTRISLKEAYDNKDVAVQIFSLRDDVDKHSEILENLPDPDLTNCVLKTGAQTIAGEKTFTDTIKAEGGIEVDTESGFEINGPLTVNGDIIQNGQAYETHAEQVFSQNDLIVTRDGAVSALPAGVVSGLQIKKYDGVNDARLAVDNAGVARVGDVGDEQPLMTRAESADMVGGAFLKWDSAHSKAVSGTLDDAPTAGSSNGVKSSGIKSAIDDAKTAVEGELATVEGNLETAIAGKVSGTGNIGSDTKPVKIVNGVAVEVADALVKRPIAIELSSTNLTMTGSGAWNKIPLSNVTKTGDVSEFTIGTDRVVCKKSGVCILTYHLAGNLNATGSIYIRTTPVSAQSIEGTQAVSHSYDMTCIFPVSVGTEITFEMYNASSATTFTALNYNKGFYASIMIM